MEVDTFKDGKLIDHKNFSLTDKNKSIEIPFGDEQRLTFKHNDYLSETQIIKKDQDKVKFDPKKIEQGKTLIAEGIQFEIDSWYLRKESLGLLQSLADSMKKKSNLKLKIFGYTDSSGDSKYNIKLSEKRADAVAEFLIKNGISAERITSFGRGAANPVAPNTTEEGRRKNRRTEFVFE